MSQFDKKVQEIEFCLRRYGKHKMNYTGKAEGNLSFWKCSHCPYSTRAVNKPE
jgi:hypothetical protein